jgi:hypothetical protein
VKSLILLLVLSTSFSAYASAPSLDNLSEIDAKEIGKEFGANFVHTTVSPASSLGSIIGFEVGLAAGATSTPKIEEISSSVDSSADISAIPHAGLIGALSVPGGFTLEVNMIPERDMSDVSFEHFSGALKWTITNAIPLPFDLALRLHGSSSTLSYSDTINNSTTSNQDVDTTVSFGTSSLGANLSASVNALVFEPYAGIGFVKTETDIETSASTSVGIFNFSNDQKFTAENSGTHIFAGANINLFVLKLGFEYGKVMDLTRMTFKLSAYF